MKSKLLFVCTFALIISLKTTPAEETSEYVFKEEGFGYVKSDTVWCSADGNIAKKIYVCWENPTDDIKERKLVEKVVKEQLGKHGDLDFAGWGVCSNNAGIRILIDDSGPHVKELGRKLDGVVNGMVLNFTFKNWSPSCSISEEARLSCIQSIGLHEFGHALGFAHEHNRADRPGECEAPAQGGNGDVMLTPYDSESFLNYCNPDYNNNGVLSKLDIQSVQAVYSGDNTYGFCE